MSDKKVRLVECPRDAMQGWKNFIPTEKKIRYINALLQAGFDTIDFGSFVSAKAIPQMADTKEVVKGIEIGAGSTRLLAIIANTRGAEEAIQYDVISYLGFPFSVSETFQQRNTNSSIAEALRRVGKIQNLCIKTGRLLVVYISMGFGNPYNDPYSEEIVFNWVHQLVQLDIKIISLADTVGLADPEQVHRMTKYLVDSFPGIETGVHLHSRPDNWKEKLEAALKAGCRRFDGAIRGIGGCPMANDELVGNMNTEWMIRHFKEKNIETGIQQQALEKSIRMADEIFV